MSTENLIAIDNAATFPDFVEEVSIDVAKCRELSDIDVRDDVVYYWKNHATWKIPPIFLDGTTLDFS